MKKIMALLLSVAFMLGSVFAFTACEPTLDRDSCLVVATNAYFPPFEYYEGNKLSGIDMKIASLFAEKLGKTLYVKDMEFDAVLPSVQIKESDIVMAGLTVTDERKKTVNFTSEYYESAQVIIVRQGDNTFAGCTSAADIEAKLKEQSKSYKVGTQKGTTGYMYTAGDEDFGYDGFDNLTVKDYSTGALAARDLQNGNVDAVIIDKQPALMIAQSLNAGSNTKLTVLGNYELTAESYAFALNKDNSKLLEEANAFLAEIKNNGKLEQIINSFFDGTADFTYTNPKVSF